jgi:hypothetical protein
MEFVKEVRGCGHIAVVVKHVAGKHTQAWCADCAWKKGVRFWKRWLDDKE